MRWIQSQQTYKAALSAAYGAGLRVSEVVALKVSDIDSKRMLLKVEQGKRRKDQKLYANYLNMIGMHFFWNSCQRGSTNAGVAQ